MNSLDIDSIGTSNFLFKSDPILGNLAQAGKRVEYQAGVGRWSAYKGRPQSTAQHIASAIAVTAPIILEILQMGGVSCNQLLVLKAVAVHDVGEIHHLDDGNENDVLYADKTSEKDLKEYRKFLEIYDPFREYYKKGNIFNIPPDGRIFHSLHQAYLLQYADDNPDIFPDNAREVMADLQENHLPSIKAFDFIERFGYLQYAYEQYRCEDNVRIFVQTLNSQGVHIDRLIKYFSQTMNNTCCGVAQKERLWGEKIRNRLYEFTEEHGKKYPNPAMHGKEVWFPDQTPAPGEMEP